MVQKSNRKQWRNSGQLTGRNDYCSRGMQRECKKIFHQESPESANAGSGDSSFISWGSFLNSEFFSTKYFPSKFKKNITHDTSPFLSSAE